MSPFVSPDGQWIGFVESTSTPTFARIKKVSILGGPAIVVAQLPDLPFAGATWLTDGTIVLATTRGLKKIAPTGAVTDVTTSDPSAGERAHAWPSAVSGSTMVLFAITPVSAAARPKIAVVDVSNGRMVRLPIEGTGPRYASTGHIVYAASDGTLSAAPFDLQRLAVTGPSAIVLERVIVKPSGASNFDLSSDGQLVFAGGSARGGTVTAVGRSCRARNADQTLRPAPISIPGSHAAAESSSMFAIRSAISGSSTAGAL